MPKIHIPTPLRQYAGKQPAVEVTGTTVGEALSGLVSSILTCAVICIPTRASSAPSSTFI